MGAKVNNNAFGTLAVGISDSDTAITLQAGQGSRFPTIASGEYFYATLINVSNQLEIIKVTARVGDVLTVVRAQDGSTATSYVVGDRVEMRFVAALLNEKVDAYNGSASQLKVVDHIDFNTGVVGRVKWNPVDGTIDIGLLGGNVTLQVGQEQVQRVLNNTGTTILEKQAVYITGADDARTTVALGLANAEATSSKTFGVATENINPGAQGFITTAGMVRNVDTSAFAEGAALWLSPTVPGGVTSTKPVAPNHTVLIGYCVVSDPVAGVIFVHIVNGVELDELHDVSIGTKNDLDVLQYDLATTLWKNRRFKLPAIPPANRNSPGEQGQMTYDSNYGYICVSANNWLRFNLNTW